MVSANEHPIRFILASSSPRRRELLEGLGLAFIIHPSEADEDVPVGTKPAALVEMLSLRKAQAVAQYYEQGLVIGSDTIVVLEDRILGKPVDEEDAFSMLSQIQGRTHTVYSGVAIVDAKSGEALVEHQSTQVTMRSLSEWEIRKYIKTGEPMDKAGSYAIQGLGATLVEGIEGDYFTVVGFPVGLFARMLRKFGIDILSMNAEE
jgi:septum formation protein